MRLLLDTMIVIWWRTDSPRLRPPVRAAIAEAEQIFVSAASAWEFAIKSSLGQLRLEGSFAEGVRDSGFEQLPVTFEHAAHVADLPFHHRDPFDRLLVAQAMVERLTLVTSDDEIARYPVKVLRA